MSYYVPKQAAEISKLHKRIEDLKTVNSEQSKMVTDYTFKIKAANEKIAELEKYLDEHISLTEEYDKKIIELKAEILHLERLK